MWQFYDSHGFWRNSRHFYSSNFGVFLPSLYQFLLVSPQYQNSSWGRHAKAPMPLLEGVGEASSYGFNVHVFFFVQGMKNCWGEDWSSLEGFLEKMQVNSPSSGKKLGYACFVLCYLVETFSLFFRKQCVFWCLSFFLFSQEALRHFCSSSWMVDLLLSVKLMEVAVVQHGLNTNQPVSYWILNVSWKQLLL